MQIEIKPLLFNHLNMTFLPGQLISFYQYYKDLLSEQWQEKESGNQRVLPMANSSGKAGIRGGIVRNHKYLVSSQILTSITKQHLAFWLYIVPKR